MATHCQKYSIWFLVLFNNAVYSRTQYCGIFVVFLLIQVELKLIVANEGSVLLKDFWLLPLQNGTKVQYTKLQSTILHRKWQVRWLMLFELQVPLIRTHVSACLLCQKLCPSMAISQNGCIKCLFFMNNSIWIQVFSNVKQFKSGVYECLKQSKFGNSST